MLSLELLIKNVLGNDDELSGFQPRLATSCAIPGGSWILHFHQWIVMLFPWYAVPYLSTFGNF